VQVPCLLSRIMVSGLFLGIVLSVRTGWFYNMVTLPSHLIYTNFGTWSYWCWLYKFPLFPCICYSAVQHTLYHVSSCTVLLPVRDMLICSGVPRGFWVFTPPPPPKFRRFNKAEPIYQFRGKFIRNNLIRMQVSFICKLSGIRLGGCRPQNSVLSALCPQLNLLPPPRKNSWVRHCWYDLFHCLIKLFIPSEIALVCNARSCSAVIPL
jgi:hypothetical protein